MATAQTSELSCRDVTELVTGYLEGSLEPDRLVQVERHLAACPDCVTYLENNRDTVLALRRLELPALPEDLCAELLDAFHGWKVER